MNEWTGRLIEQDKQAEPDQASLATLPLRFTFPQHPLTRSVCCTRVCGVQLDGLFYTDAPVLLFKFINQQIDVVRPTACPRFIGLVAEECLTVLERYQKALFHTIRSTCTFIYLFSIKAIVCVCVCVSLMPRLHSRLKMQRRWTACTWRTYWP